MLRRKLLWVAMAVGALQLSGCEKALMTDPNTGETNTVYSLDTEVADKVEGIAEVVVTTGGGIAPLVPWLAPFVAAGVAGLGTWRKIRPRLEAATRDRDIGAKAGATLAEALEELKTKHPVVWDDIKPIIKKASVPMTEIEKAIRGFRGIGT